MTAYNKFRTEHNTTDYEEAIHHQVKEKKEQRAKQLAEVEARRRISYRSFKRKY